MSGIVSFDDLFPLKANPSALDRVFGFDSEDGKSRGFTIQSILDLIDETPVTWAEITGKPGTFAPSAHTIGSHSNVAAAVDSAADGTFLKKVGGQITAAAVDFYGVSNPPPPDPSIDNAVRLITATKTAQWDSAFGWGNHAGQYRPIAWVPTWGEVTGKPATFAPAAHTLGSHSDAAALATATNGQLVRKAAVGFEAFTADYYSPFNPPPADASIPDFVRDFTIGQFADYEAKMLEFAGLPDGTVPLIKGGVPADSQILGVYSENPFDPETETEDYDAWEAELLHLISAKRIKGVPAVDDDDFVIKSQLEGLGGGGSGTSGYTDLTTFPAIPFDKKYRYSHEMFEPVEISVNNTLPRAFPNHSIIYIKADGTNKPTFKESDNFSVVYDGWNNNVGEWNRIRIEWSPQGNPVVQIMDTSGAANPGAGATDFELLFDGDYSFSHVISGSVSLSVDNTAAAFPNSTIFYFQADGTNKPLWNAPIECNFDNYVNEAGVWNRFYLEYTPENKVTLQIQNT